MRFYTINNDGLGHDTADFLDRSSSPIDETQSVTDRMIGL